MSHIDRIDHVKETITRLETAWNHQNSYLWASAFMEPCEYIDAFGKHHHRWSHAENAKLQEQAWRVFENSRIHFKVESIDFPAEHICVVILGATLEYRAKEEEKIASYVIGGVLVKHGQDWLFRNYQNTSVRQK